MADIINIISSYKPFHICLVDVSITGGIVLPEAIAGFLAGAPDSIVATRIIGIRSS